MRPSSPLQKQFRVAREGKGWLAVAPGFLNLEESPFGFALTRELAILQLLESAECQLLMEIERWHPPSVADFVEVELIEEDAPDNEAPAQIPRLVYSR